MIITVSTGKQSAVRMEHATRQLIEKATGSIVYSCEPVSGGSINQCFHLQKSNGIASFCKLNSAVNFPHLFAKEKAGLDALRGMHILRVPEVISLWEDGAIQFLELEWIEPSQPRSNSWKKFGEALAALHAVKGPYFGFPEDNYMGSVPQSNRQHHNWASFFRAERLQPLAERCFEKALLPKEALILLENLYAQLAQLFPDEPPALLHGDLWAGNFLFDANGSPVLIDPAVYYGHRSMDLAMTTLFAGFHDSFYEAYNYHYPFPENHKVQWEICNLYPLLVHLLLFGPSYLPGIVKTLRRYG